MHVGLNAQLLALDSTYRGAGINTYIHQLLRALERLDSPHRFTAFTAERRFRAGRMAVYYSAGATRRPWGRVAWEQTALPVVARRRGVDLLHAMAFVAPLLGTIPTVVTVYDLSFLRFPEAFRPFNRWYLSRFTPLAVRRARRVITISESTRRDVIERLGVPPERVDVVYCGCDPAFRPLPAPEVARFRRANGLPDRFMLYVGTLEPRKNILGLLAAYARWRDGGADVMPLVLAGARGWYYDEVFRRVEALGLVDAVRFVGYVAGEDLPLLYNAAEALVYPSRFEGFGLPVLEAMACGLPVICSNAASLPEVAGEAGWLVDPGDEIGLAEAMQRVAGDGTLRREMSARGLARANAFSWESAARQTVRTYERALDG
jgi:glycosyltransferase involved in cell wall biosynthesis